MSNKVLFLDIDGVCNSEAYARSDRHKKGSMLGIDPEAASIVRQIVEHTKCVIVVSSSWRLHDDLLEKVKQTFGKAVVDVTPWLPAIRGQEVQAWLELHPHVERYAILDDDSDFYDNQPLFKTKFKHGITMDIAQAVVRHLNAA